MSYYIILGWFRDAVLYTEYGYLWSHYAQPAY